MHRKIKHRPFVTNKNQEDFVCPEIKVEVKTEVIENDEDFSFVKQIKPEDQEHRADFNGNMGILDDKEQKRVFLYAFIDDDEKAFLHRIVSRLGGISRPHEMMYVSDATHIVIPNQESEKLCPKVIGALASGKIVVKASYLYFCDKENAFADEKGFIPKSAQDALAHIKQHGKLFVNDTVIVYLTNSRRQAELKNILRDGGAQVLNWSYKDLSQKSPEETAKVTTVFTDLSACSNRHFNEFQARRAAEGKPVKVLSYVCIFKLVLHSSLGDQRKVFEDLFSVTNEALMSKLHPKVSEPEIEIVPTQTRAGMGTRQEKKIEEVTLNTSSEDTDDDIEVLDEKISNVRPPKVFAYTQYRPSFRRRKTDNANDTVIDLVSSDEEAVEPKKEINEDINSGATLEIIQASNSKEKICPETIISPELEKVEEPPVKKRILNLGLTASGTRPAFLDFGTITQPEPSQDSSESSSEENEPMLGSPVAADAEDSQDTANANPSQIAEDSSSNQDESTAMSTDEDISQDHTVMQITENDDCVTSHGDDNISQTEGTLQPDGVNLFQENGGLSSECITSFKPIEVEDSVLEKAIQRFLYNQEVENMGLETGVVKTPCYDRHHESRLKKEFLNNRNQPLSAPIEDNDRFFDDFLKSSRDKAPLLKSLNVLFLAIRPVLSSRSYFAPDVLSNVMSEIASRKGPPSLRLFIIHEYLGLLHEQLRYHPTTRMDMRNYYVTFFGGNIPDFVHNTVTSALKRDANFQLYVGMLDFAVTVLKQDLEYWWRHHKGRKATEEPLVKIYATKLPPCGTSNLLNFLEEIYAYRVIEDIERCQKVPKLTGIMMKLMAVIGIYFGVREDRTARPLSRKKNLKQNLSADLGNMFVKMYGNKSIKEIVMRTSLIRPSWLSTLVTLKFLKAERFQDSRQVFSADPAIQAILKRLPSKTLGENINRSPRELLLHLLNEFLCTYPVHAIARAVLNDEEVKIKTLKAWQSKNAGKEVALGRNIRFDNYVAFKKADIMSDVRLCVNLISRLKIQNGPGKLSHWHFL